MVLGLRHSPELGIAEFLVQDYVDGVREELGWRVSYAGPDDRDLADIGLHYHPRGSEGIRRDIEEGRPVIVFQDKIGIPFGDDVLENATLISIPPGLTRDEYIDRIAGFLSAYYGGEICYQS